MPSDMRALLHSGEAPTQHTIDPPLPQHKRMKSDWLAEGSRVVSSRPRGVKELRARPHGDASTGRQEQLHRELSGGFFRVEKRAISLSVTC